MQAVDYLKAHSLNIIEDLDTAISNLNQTIAPLRKQLKQNENRMRSIAQIKDAAAIYAAPNYGYEFSAWGQWSPDSV